MADITPTQGRYLAFIRAYTNLHGYPPAESEIAAAMCVSPPSVNQMVKTLEKRGLILRHPGRPRSLQILLRDDEIPSWNGRDRTWRAPHSTHRGSGVAVVPALPANLYVVSVYLTNGPLGDKFAIKEISRAIEIRGDQTLEQLHQAIFEAYDRADHQRYEFHLGKRPFDPDGPSYVVPDRRQREKRGRDARTATLDDLVLKVGRGFGYRFDFRDDWCHLVQVDRIERAIPTVSYPRIIRRVGKSPPQHPVNSELRKRRTT